MSLFSLPNELITSIAETLHPSSIVDFATTCRRFHGCAEGVLALHRERQQTLRAQHDRNPVTIVGLLRMGMTSPDLLWYIRVLEFYGTRKTWDDWKTYDNYERIKDEPKVDFTDGSQEIEEELIKFLEEKFAASLNQEHMKCIYQGDDEILKAMLIASCPKLRKVTWVAHEPDNPPFEVLGVMAKTYYPLQPSRWPLGLQSLRSISIGACTEHVHPHDNLHPEIQDFCLLLLLPNLKSLRINIGGYGEQDLVYLNNAVPARSSSVEEIHFYICEFDGESTTAILQRLRSLRKFIDGPWTELLKTIQPWFGDTLEELYAGGENDSSSAMYGDISILAEFSKLKVFEIRIGDLIQGDTETLSADEIREGKFEWYDFDTILPPLTEKIIFAHDPTSLSSDKHLCQGFFERMDKLVQKRGLGHGGYLKTISLGFARKYEDVDEIQNPHLEEMIQHWKQIWKGKNVELVTDVENFEEKIETEPISNESEDDSD